MRSNIKNIIITIGFVLILVLVFVGNVIEEDKSISTAERRKLAQFPEITIEKILNGKAMEEWEKYVEDQFIERDLFRSIKSFWSMKVFAQKDNNGLFEKDDAIYKIYKMDYPINENNVRKTAKKINEVYNRYLKDMDVYYSIIPDKAYYLENDDHLSVDSDKMEEIFHEELKELNYINLKDVLKLEDYYRTDPHWKQENLQEVVKTIQKNIGIEEIKVDYEIHNKGEFYGAYYGQLGVNVTPENLNILTNETIEDCITYNFETKKNAPVYTETKSSDMYDIFVSGPTPLITIENPNAKTDKELLLFRDSFGSSLAPLLVENYNKITLIDLRYIASQVLDAYIEFKDQDVLFLYSSLIIEQNILK